MCIIYNNGMEGKIKTSSLFACKLMDLVFGVVVVTVFIE